MKVIRKNIASAKTMPYLVLIRMNVRSCGFSLYMQRFYSMIIPQQCTRYPSSLAIEKYSTKGS